jgi:hypothetical protein
VKTKKRPMERVWGEAGQVTWGETFFSMGFGTFVGQGCKNLEKKSFDPRRRSEEKLDRWLEMVPQIHMVNNHKSHVTPSFCFLVLPWFWGILGQTWA